MKKMFLCIMIFISVVICCSFSDSIMASSATARAQGFSINNANFVSDNYYNFSHPTEDNIAKGGKYTYGRTTMYAATFTKNVPEANTKLYFVYVYLKMSSTGLVHGNYYALINQHENLVITPVCNTAGSADNLKEISYTPESIGKVKTTTSNTYSFAAEIGYTDNSGASVKASAGGSFSNTLYKDNVTMVAKSPENKAVSFDLKFNHTSAKNLQGYAPYTGDFIERFCVIYEYENYPETGANITFKLNATTTYQKMARPIWGSSGCDKIDVNLIDYVGA